MSNRIELVKTTTEAAYNYDGAMRDAIHALNEAAYWLERMTEFGKPDSLSGETSDRDWANAKYAEVRDLVAKANFVKFGREGVTLA